MILRKFRSEFNSFRDVYLFFQILLIITLLPILFRLLSLPGLIKKFTPRSVKYQENASLKKTTDKIVKFIDFILKRDFGRYKENTCLKRSLVLYYYLRKHGIDVHICFGVKYDDKATNTEEKNRLIGHAWLLYNGNILLEKNAAETKTYKVTYSFPEDENKV